MIPIEDLEIPLPIRKKLAGFIYDTDRLRTLEPWVLCKEFSLTDAQYATLGGAVVLAGEPPLAPLVKPERAAPKVRAPRRCVDIVEKRPNRETDVECGRPWMKGKRKCEWHWLLAQPIATQIVAADQRRAIMETAPDFVERKRVPESEWPQGHRWCSECQCFVPLFYVQGSKCKAHASRAAHASMVQRVYDLSREEYDSLLAWQRGRCYICQELPRVRRLAIDHDHVTGEVRGLLCANNEWGCNVTLRRLLNNPDMARRALAYVERWPLSRMRSGEDPVTLGRRRPAPAGPVQGARPDFVIYDETTDADAAIAAFFSRRPA